MESWNYVPSPSKTALWVQRRGCEVFILTSFAPGSSWLQAETMESKPRGVESKFHFRPSVLAMGVPPSGISPTRKSFIWIVRPVAVLCLFLSFCLVVEISRTCSSGSGIIVSPGGTQHIKQSPSEMHTILDLLQLIPNCISNA